MKKYKKKIVIKKPKIQNPKKEVNNIMNELGFAKTVFLPQQQPIPQSELIKQEKIITNLEDKLKAIESGKSDPNKLMVVLQKTLSNITYNQIQNDPEIKAIEDTGEISK
jgi:hypothetical protein